MGTPVLILGESGAGKSTSLRNLNPEETLLIQAVKKPLPFRNNWKAYDRQSKTGSVIVSDNSGVICDAIKFFPSIGKKVIVIDDWNLVMTNEYMRRSDEKGYQKFSDIGRNAWNILSAALTVPDDIRIYFLGHTETNEHGQIKAKTIGKMIDQTCPVESMFTIVLRTNSSDGKYMFSTQNNGQDTCKSPMGMFESDFIDNDLSIVDNSIKSYYGI